MGRSIRRETWELLEKRRREGELCQGPGQDCTSRATVVITQESWTYEVGKGQPSISTLKMCPRHARSFPVGYQGGNFRVLGVAA